MKVLLSILGVVVGLGMFAFLFWFSLFVVLIWWNFASGGLPPTVNLLFMVATGVASVALGTFTTYSLSHAKWPTAAVAAVSLVSIAVVLISVILYG
jgi:hypothetical protein